MYRYTPGLELAGYQIGGADFFVGQFGMGMYIAAYGSDFGFPSDDGFGQLHGCSPILFVEWNFTPVSDYHQILAWNRNIVWSSLFSVAAQSCRPARRRYAHCPSISDRQCVVWGKRWSVREVIG